MIFETEVELMKQLRHKNIIQLHEYHNESTYSNENIESSKTYSIILEYAPKGELFDYISKTGSFDDKTCRHYFHQMVDGLDHMWSKNIKHCDIKLDNLLLDQDYVLKYIDFGWSTKQKYFTEAIGTSVYHAPESFLTGEYETKPMDIFSLGVVLFIMFTQVKPFKIAKPDDKLYKAFVSNNNKFWLHFDKTLKNKKISQSFKELINTMLSPHPENRPYIEDIRRSDWYNESLPDEEEVITELEHRSSILDQM